MPERGNRDKIVTILLKTWITVPPDIEMLRVEGLRLLKILPRQNHMAIHWGMVMAAYPFWSGVAVQVGRLLKLQGAAAATHIQRRVRERYGERETAARAARRVLRSYLDWGVLQETGSRGIYCIGATQPIDDSRSTVSSKQHPGHEYSAAPLINLGPQTEIPNEKAARAKLAVILDPINDAKHRPKKMMTFRSFIEKIRALKLANQKGTTQHGYETNIRAHYLPEYGDMELSDAGISQQEGVDGKAVQTLKNMKWGLSSIFVAAMKYGYMKSNPARGTDLPSEGIRERHELPSPEQIIRLIERLKEPVSTAVWLTAVTCVRPEELAFKWKDLDAERRELWVVRAVNRGKLHTPKYHPSNRPIRLTQADVERLLALKARTKAKDDDWVFPNQRKTGPIWHEDLLARSIQPVAKELGLPHITWRLLRHWGPRRRWKDVCPSRRRKSALDTRAPTLFSSSTPMSWMNLRTWRQRP